MTRVLSCDAFREIAPELALGTAVGDERAAALDHVRNCAACRQVLADLAATVDALLLSAPTAEPPEGFELRALASFDGLAGTEPAAPVAPIGRRRSVRWLLAAAAVLLVAVGSLVLAQRATGPDTTVTASGVLRTAQGGAVGAVAVEEGSELVVSADGGAPAGTYRVQCDYESGGPYTAGRLVIGPDGLDRWSATVTVPTYDLRRVRLVSTDGTANLEAEMSG